MRSTRRSPARSPSIRPADTAVVSTRRSVASRRRRASSKTRSSRSTGRRGNCCKVCSSALANSSRSSTRRWTRTLSARTVVASSAVVARSGWARATSACWRMEATGERSSWEASAMKRRSRALARSRRPSMRFMVCARRAISSAPGGSGTRRCSSAAEISSTSPRIASTGANARPTTFHVVAATTSNSTGSPTASRPVTIQVASPTPSRARATTTVSRALGAAVATARKGSLSTGTSTLADSPERRRVTGGNPATLGLEATTRPPSSKTWISRSSVLSMPSSPGRVPDSRTAATSAARARAALPTSRVRVTRRTTTSTTAPAAMATPTTTTAATVVRTRTVPTRVRIRVAQDRRSSAAIGRQPVASPAHRLDRDPTEGPVELVAQTPHVHLDDVGVALEVVVPDVLEDLALGDDLAPAAHQELQQGWPLPGAPAQQGPQPGEQHRVGERLGQVVIGAGVERLDLVPLAPLGGKHQDRRPDPFLPQRLADLVAVDAGQHDVEDDRVIGVFPGQPQPVVAVQGNVDGEPLRLEPIAEPGGEPLLVLDHQHPHCLPSTRSSEDLYTPVLNYGQTRPGRAERREDLNVLGGGPGRPPTPVSRAGWPRSSPAAPGWPWLRRRDSCCRPRPAGRGVGCQGAWPWPGRRHGGPAPGSIRACCHRRRRRRRRWRRRQRRPGVPTARVGRGRS